MTVDLHGAPTPSQNVGTHHDLRACCAVTDDSWVRAGSDGAGIMPAWHVWRE